MINKKKKKNDIKKKVEYKDLTEKKAFAWTRVSTREQEKKGHSLDYQKRMCKDYAERNNIQIVDYLGGEFESAQEEGKLYQQMVDRVLETPDINIILTDSFDRFSRTGAKGILTKETLKKNGKYIISVTQEVDPDSESGEMIEDFHLLFSKFENNMRRAKCIKGMKECIHQGYWYNILPRGYSRKKVDKEHIITVNKEGELLREAFTWKAYENITNEEILDRLKARGLKLTKQTLSDIFQNPFYCGYIIHAYTNYEPKIGKHEILISETIFNIVNGIETNSGYTQNKGNELYPLNSFIKCPQCSTNTSINHFTGYERIKKKSGKIYYYYKCNTKGCKCNTNLESMHDRFTGRLYSYLLPNEVKPIFSKVLTKLFKEQNEANFQQHKELSHKLTDIENQINEVSLKYGLGKINDEVYNITISKLKEDKEVLSKEVNRLRQTVSNSIEYVDKTIKMASNIGGLWKNGDYNIRKKVQNLAYPNGIFYDKEIGMYRTDGENKVFKLFSKISSICRGIKKSDKPFLSSLSDVVEHSTKVSNSFCEDFEKIVDFIKARDKLSL